jgi:hypothetical protein
MCSTTLDPARKGTLLRRKREELWRNIVRFADFVRVYGWSEGTWSVSSLVAQEASGRLIALTFPTARITCATLARKWRSPFTCVVGRD